MRKDILAALLVTAPATIYAVAKLSDSTTQDKIVSTIPLGVHPVVLYPAFDTDRIAEAIITSGRTEDFPHAIAERIARLCSDVLKARSGRILNGDTSEIWQVIGETELRNNEEAHIKVYDEVNRQIGWLWLNACKVRQQELEETYSSGWRRILIEPMMEQLYKQEERELEHIRKIMTPSQEETDA